MLDDLATFWSRGDHGALWSKPVLVFSRTSTGDGDVSVRAYHFPRWKFLALRTEEIRGCETAG